MQTYLLGAIAALGAAATAVHLATGHLGLAIVFGASTLSLAASAMAARAPARPATSNQGAIRAVLDSVSLCAVILAIVFLATGHRIWLAPSSPSVSSPSRCASGCSEGSPAGPYNGQCS